MFRQSDRTLPSNIIPYSGKFSLVQNFAELPPRPSEENFVVLNFTPVLPQDHTYCQLISTSAMHLMCKALHRDLIFVVLIFAVVDLSVKNAKFSTM